LASRNAVSQEDADNDHARMLSYQAAVSAARAQVAAARAAAVTPKSQEASPLSEVEASRALSERIRADIDDSDLTAPRDGRVQYLVARVGEVVAAGGRLLIPVDLSDVYMPFCLPTAAAGRLELGSEARLILEAAPNRVIRAPIS